MSHLDTLLDHIGFEHRAPQDRLYEALIRADHRGLVAQAGTGTGKSIAVLAAAAEAVMRRGVQSLIVTPTRVLMDQYMASDAPAAAEAFGIEVAELRGKAHYFCQQSSDRADLVGVPYENGCWAEDASCSIGEWGRGDGYALTDPVFAAYECGYQEAKWRASRAAIVVTNTDFWMINDRILAPMDAAIFDPHGSLFVDEAHQLDRKMREYASRSMSAKRLRNYAYASAAGCDLADWIERQGENRILSESPNFPVKALLAVANAVPDEDAGKAARETNEAARAIVARMTNPIDQCVMYVSEQAIRMDWTSVAKAAGETLTARPFALVSATIPRSMPRVLGVPEAEYVNVGHPFNYGRSTISLSAHAGDFKSRGSDNFRARIDDVQHAIHRSEGGTLLLVNSRRDCEYLAAYLGRRMANYDVRAQTDEQWENADLTEWFKSPGDHSRRVLIGMESFKTGVDFPGSILTTVILWALPYPAGPIWSKIAAIDFRRYDDEMRVSAVQAIGRLVRKVEDSGHVLIADSRGERLLNAQDPLTSHLVEFRRV